MPGWSHEIFRFAASGWGHDCFKNFVERFVRRMDARWPSTAFGERWYAANEVRIVDKDEAKWRAREEAAKRKVRESESYIPESTWSRSSTECSEVDEDQWTKTSGEPGRSRQRHSV